MNNKIIEVIRKASLFPDVRSKDTFDAICNVYQHGLTLPIYSCDQVNTDPKNGYAGGRLAPGRYAWIKGKRQDNGKEALFLFEPAYYESVFKASDLTIDMRTLKSSIPNPNHEGARIITCVMWHVDSKEGGYSAGCFTMQPLNFEKFIALFADGEKGFIDLREAA